MKSMRDWVTKSLLNSVTRLEHERRQLDKRIATRQSLLVVRAMSIKFNGEGPVEHTGPKAKS